MQESFPCQAWFRVLVCELLGFCNLSRVFHQNTLLFHRFGQDFDFVNSSSALKTLRISGGMQLGCAGAEAYENRHFLGFVLWSSYKKSLESWSWASEVPFIFFWAAPFPVAPAVFFSLKANFVEKLLSVWKSLDLFSFRLHRQIWEVSLTISQTDDFHLWVIRLNCQNVTFLEEKNHCEVDLVSFDEQDLAPNACKCNVFRAKLLPLSFFSPGVHS